MKMFRVMGNSRGRGTFVYLDRIPTEKEAKKLATKLTRVAGRATSRTHVEAVAYFTQEYEESRELL